MGSYVACRHGSAHRHVLDIAWNNEQHHPRGCRQRSMECTSSQQKLAESRLQAGASNARPNSSTGKSIRKRKWFKELSNDANPVSKVTDDIKKIQRKLERQWGAGSAGRGSGSVPSAVLDKVLVKALSSLERAEQQDLTRLDVVCQRILALSDALDADVSLVTRLAAGEGKLLLMHPRTVQDKLEVMSKVLGLSVHDALSLASRAPALLKRSPQDLGNHMASLQAVLKSRGLPALQDLASSRPDVLLLSPAAMAAKLDALPSIFGSGRLAAQVLKAWPGLLRRSTASVQQRHQNLVSLLPGLPRSYISELLSAAPGLMALTPDMLRAKHVTLVNKYGAFRDDVVDVILVDPNALLNAVPTYAANKSVSSQTTSAPLRISDNRNVTTSSQHPSDTQQSSTSNTTATHETKAVVSGHEQRKSPDSASSSTDRRDSHVTTSPGTESDAGSVSMTAVEGIHAHHDATVVAGRHPSTVHQLMSWSASVGVPLFDVLQLYAQSTGNKASSISLEDYSQLDMLYAADLNVDGSSSVTGRNRQPSTLVKRIPSPAGSSATVVFKSLPRVLQSVCATLGVDLDTGKSLVCRAPALLTMRKQDIRSRIHAMHEVLEGTTTGTDDSKGQSNSPHVSATSNQSARSAQLPSSWKPSQAVVDFLSRQPEVLLREPEDLQESCAVMQRCLGLKDTTVRALLAQQPRLLVLNSQQLEAQLQELGQVFGGVSGRVLGELVGKAPSLLDPTALPDVRRRFEGISTSFGSFTDDALGVVLADPSILLQDASDRVSMGPGSPTTTAASVDALIEGAGPQTTSAQSLRAQSDVDFMTGALPAGSKRDQDVQTWLRDGPPGMTDAFTKNTKKTGRGGAASQGTDDGAQAAAAAMLDAMMRAESEPSRLNEERRRQARQAKKQKAKGGQQQQGPDAEMP